MNNLKTKHPKTFKTQKITLEKGKKKSETKNEKVIFK